MVVPAKNGEVSSLVLAAAALSGVTKFGELVALKPWLLAYGTQTIASVDKIVAPGKFVAAAKRQVFGDVGIDNIA